MKKRVVVFGIFDGIHEGHRFLFAQAREKGNELIVIVGRDSSALRWKGKKPRYSQEERLALTRKEQGVNEAVLGDEEQSQYGVLAGLRPDIVCLGYDQEDLELDLRKWMAQKGWDTPIFRLLPFEPSLYHNSFRG